MRWPCLLALFGTFAAAADLAGPDACRSCHAAAYATQSKSKHALALRPIPQSPLPELFSSQTLAERSGIRFQYESSPDGLTVTARRGEESATALLEWAFGAGAQAITPVGRINGRYLEHRISWYSAAGGARRTMGHAGSPSADPLAALGLPQDPDTIFRCFSCHATGVKAGPDLRSMIPGVTCERCHGAAGEHVTSGAAMRPAKLNREAVMALCGSCHRLPAARGSRSPEADDPISIRFAPVGLTASACFRRSRDLSCLTCHSPHDDASRSVSSYEAQCRGCHEQRNTCPSSSENGCLACHMQKRSPEPYLTFTDHRIRIYRKKR